MQLPKPSSMLGTGNQEGATPLRQHALAQGGTHSDPQDCEEFYRL